MRLGLYRCDHHGELVGLPSSLPACNCANVSSFIVNLKKVQYWQLIGIPRPISSYCFYMDICPSPNLSPNLYPNLLQLPILHL